MTFEIEETEPGCTPAEFDRACDRLRQQAADMGADGSPYDPADVAAAYLGVGILLMAGEIGTEATAEYLQRMAAGMEVQALGSDLARH